VPRKVWVTTTSFRPADRATVDGNLKRARVLLERACASQPDIICLPETFCTMGIPRPAAELAQVVPGPITEMVAEVAKSNHTYVIAPLLRWEAGRVYNSAVLTDRSGVVVGTYDKVHPVPNESYHVLEAGVTPGLAPRVFDTDFGRIGILICFDINWPQEWRTLKEEGAEIIFWPSAYEGGLPLRSRALDHHYYVVSAVTAMHSRIIDVTSRILAETGPYRDIVEAKLDLERVVFSTDYNERQLPAIQARYGRSVTVETCLDEDIFTLESQRDDLCVDDIIREFGLVPWCDYIARSADAQASQRLGAKG
jgi:beta-ureidopropionase